MRAAFALLAFVVVSVVAACGRGDAQTHARAVAPAAASVAPAPFAVPPLVGRVNDHANELLPLDQAEIEEELADFDRRTTNEIVVLIVPSLGGHSIEDAAAATFAAWKIGKRDRNNGVLLIIAVAERKVRIATGLGVEGVLTDARAGEILHSEVSPRLKRGDFAGAIRAGVREIERTLTN